MREKMSDRAQLLDKTKTLLEECQQERDSAATDALPFVQQENYGAWRLRAERAVDNAKSMLADENKLAPFFKEEPGLRQALAAPSASLGRTMREEDEDWERIKRERAEQKPPGAAPQQEPGDLDVTPLPRQPRRGNRPAIPDGYRGQSIRPSLRAQATNRSAMRTASSSPYCSASSAIT